MDINSSRLAVSLSLYRFTQITCVARSSQRDVKLGYGRLNLSLKLNKTLIPTYCKQDTR